MKNKFIRTVSQEQTNWVFDYLLDKGYKFTLPKEKLKRYIGVSSRVIVHDDSDSTWYGYKEISVDELFAGEPFKVGDRFVKTNGVIKNEYVIVVDFSEGGCEFPDKTAYRLLNADANYICTTPCADTLEELQKKMEGKFKKA